MYDILGNEVASLVDEQQQAGVYRSIELGQNQDIDFVGIPMFTILNQVIENPDGELFLATNIGLFT
ncbi:MAG: hypothetical protein IH784_05105 [Bacteroidetes bacterium]|nr:hypothetical protein [Bacteroidota bacterium]